MIKYLIIFLISFSVYAQDINPHVEFFSTEHLSQQEMRCYAHSMIGLDSVINSRAGNNPEHVFNLAQDSVIGKHISDKDIPIFTIVLGAYMWKGSPHTYAIHTFFNCATRI